MVDLLRDGKLPQKGFVKQEDTALDDFLANRFGANYARSETMIAGARATAADVTQQVA